MQKPRLTSYGAETSKQHLVVLLNDQWLYRVAAGKTLSDGFINNTTLDRKDTNNIDELTSRLKLRYLAADNLTIDFTALHLDIDNGYDAFSLDENAILCLISLDMIDKIPRLLRLMRIGLSLMH